MFLKLSNNSVSLISVPQVVCFHAVTFIILFSPNKQLSLQQMKPLATFSIHMKITDLLFCLKLSPSAPLKGIIMLHVNLSLSKQSLLLQAFFMCHVF